MSTEPFNASIMILLRRWFLWETARRAEYTDKGYEPTVQRWSFDGNPYGPLKKVALIDHPMAQRLIAEGYFQHETLPECRGTVIFNHEHETLQVTDSVRSFDQALAGLVTAEGGFGSKAVDELATYMLLHGSTDGQYSSFESQNKIELWDHEGKLFHTLLCGIDWRNSVGPHDTQWTVFTDTVSGNDDYPVIQLDLTCSCGEVDAHRLRGANVGIKPLGTAELIRRVSDGFFQS